MNTFQSHEAERAKEHLEARKRAEHRTCTKCGLQKLLGEFRGRVIRHMGFLQVSFRTSCLACTRPEVAAQVKLAKKKDRAYARACVYWRRSKRMGIKSDLRLSDVRMLLSCPCYYCGGTESEATIDRKRSDLGYTKDNIVACCYRCNTIKSDMPAEAWKHIAPVIRNAAKLGLFGEWRAEIPSRKRNGYGLRT